MPPTQANTHLATSIDEVIEKLDEIIAWAIENNSRLGYFPALYRRVTLQIKNGIAEGVFENGPRMEQFDVVFANRYLDAFYSWRNNQPCSLAWAQAFRTTKQWWPLVLQHLILGMNAHIILDLGVAAEQIAPGKKLPTLQNDFNKVNEILIALINEVQNELSVIWPALKIIDVVAGQADERFAAAAMVRIRDIAWALSKELAEAQNQQEKEAVIHKRDKEAVGIGFLAKGSSFLFSSVALLIRLTERGSIPFKINTLNRKAPQTPQQQA